VSVFFFDFLLLLYCYSFLIGPFSDNEEIQHFCIEKDPKSFDSRPFPYFLMVEISGIEPLTS